MQKDRRDVDDRSHCLDKSRTALTASPLQCSPTVLPESASLRGCSKAAMSQLVDGAVTLENKSRGPLPSDCPGCNARFSETVHVTKGFASNFRAVFESSMRRMLR